MIKYIVIIGVFLSVLLVPSRVSAENFTVEEAYSYYLYEFHLSYAGGVLAQDGEMSLSSGEAPVFPVGQWRLVILDSRGTSLYSQSFEPSALGSHGNILAAQYFNSGTTAQFMNPGGVVSLEIDLTGSRVCDDNGVCDRAVGEDEHTCPADCGSVSVVSTPPLTAAVSDQLGVSRSLGAWMMRIAYGAAGLILLVGIARTLDSRRSA